MRVCVGFRPEHLELRTASGDACFAGRLTHKENLGSEVFLHAALNGGAHRVIIRVTPGEADSVTIGDDLSIAWTPGKVLVFGADGLRVPVADAPCSEQVA